MMNRLKYLLQKEFRQIFRDPIILRMIVALPIIQLIILPLAADYEIKNINIAIVDHDHSSATQKLISTIGASGYFIFTSYGNSYSEAFREIETDKADLILEVPAGFEKNIVREGSQKIFIAVNAINGTKANVAYSFGVI